jgi:hypothetical protein
MPTIASTIAFIFPCSQMLRPCFTWYGFAFDALGCRLMISEMPCLLKMW